MRRHTFALLAALLPFAAWAADAAKTPAATAAPEPPKIGVLKGLDKTTARVSELEVPAGGSVGFGTLTIKLDTCHKRPPEEPPETTAFLEIDELRPGDDEPQRLFTGWMFASSPALSALEHPVYDVWVIDCRTVSADKSTPEQAKSAR